MSRAVERPVYNPDTYESYQQRIEINNYVTLAATFIALAGSIVMASSPSSSAFNPALYTTISATGVLALNYILAKFNTKLFTNYLSSVDSVPLNLKAGFLFSLPRHLAKPYSIFTWYMRLCTLAALALSILIACYPPPSGLFDPCVYSLMGVLVALPISPFLFKKYICKINDDYNAASPKSESGVAPAPA